MSIRNVILKFNRNMIVSDFVDCLFELDTYDIPGICEYDDDLLCDFYNRLDNLCTYQVNKVRNTNSYKTLILPNRKESLGDFMCFLQSLS